MHRLSGEHALSTLCRVLRVNRSSYYKHYRSGKSARARENEEIRRCILLIYSSHSKRPGAYKIQHLLEREYGIKISAGRVYRLMKGMNLPRMSTAIRPKSRKMNDDEGGCENHLNQEFRQNKPNAVWCSDFTYIRTDEGWAYLCVIIDLFSRKVISWTLSARHSVDFVKEAFLKAFSVRGKPEGLLFHSDRGSEYTCKEFRDLLDQCSVLQSFSAKGYPYDNSVCESFFKYLKMEETDRKHYKTREELRLDLFSYIDGYYNSKRIHSSIGYKTPNEIEKEFFMNNC